MKLNVKALAFSLAITCGLYLLFLGWVATFGWGKELVSTLSSLYIGYEPSFVGGIIGAIWGFVDGIIAGVIIGFIYNAIFKEKKKSRK
jgi:hypothetical protein